MRLWTTLLCGLFLPAASLPAQQPEDPLAAKAEKILRHDIGKWNSRWEFLDENGEVARVVHGTETIEPGPSERVLIVTTEVPALGNKSISLRFYHPVERKIHFVSVGKDGDMWLLTEEVGEDVSVSEPHKSADGSVVSIRFTTLEKKDDSRKILMERTTDGGQSWRKVFHQHLTRAEAH